MLLSEMSQFNKTVETTFIVDNWRKCFSERSCSVGQPNGVLVQVIKVVGNLAMNFSKAAADNIKGGKLASGMRGLKDCLYSVHVYLTIFELES